MLQLPDCRQDRDWNCGEAAVRCVLGFHNFAASILAGVKIASPADGVDPMGIERFLAVNCHLRTLAGSMTTGDLKHLCADMRPVICLIHRPDEHESHWVVVRGVSRGTVYFHDVESGLGKCQVPAWEAMWGASDGRRGHRYPNWGICAWPPQAG